jgi:hypothetical protein
MFCDAVLVGGTTIYSVNSLVTSAAWMWCDYFGRRCLTLAWIDVSRLN